MHKSLDEGRISKPYFIQMHLGVIGPFNYSCFGVCAVVTQDYLIEVNNEHVIRGNTAILKCFIPSFVADFVYVASWLDNEGNEYPAPYVHKTDTTYYGICHSVLCHRTLEFLLCVSQVR